MEISLNLKLIQIIFLYFLNRLNTFVNDLYLTDANTLYFLFNKDQIVQMTLEFLGWEKRYVTGIDHTQLVTWPAQEKMTCSRLGFIDLSHVCRSVVVTFLDYKD